jgi:hypothetical protein
MADKELDKANKGYDQHYKDEKAENIATREMIAGPLRKAKDYVVDKLKGMDQRSIEDVVKDKLKSMDQRTLKEVTTDKMDQRSIEDVVKGKPPKYKDEVAKKKGGSVSYKSGGSVSSASKRADGCAVKGKTKGRMV